MKWKQVSEYALVSHSGCYSVAKYGSSSGRFTYAAWRTPQHPLGRLMLAGNLPDANAAKATCERDHQG